MTDDETPKVKRPGALAKYWIGELNGVEKDTAYRSWYERNTEIVRRYRDERELTQAGAAKNVNTTVKYNIFWSSEQTLGPAIYGRPPIPIVERTFKDKDPVAKCAAEILQRSLHHCTNGEGFDDTIKRARSDYLLVGRGVPWVRYSAKYETARVEVVATPGGWMGRNGPVTGDVFEDGGAYYQEIERLVDESAPLDHVYWRDFAHKRCRSWAEVERDGWVARRVRFTKEKATERFGKVAEELPYTDTPDPIEDEKLSVTSGSHKRANLTSVWEIWDIVTKRAIWISTSYDKKPLDVKDDPLELPGFFPCPKPMYATMTTNTLVPVPDYAMVQDQIEELDTLTERISLITSAIRVVGFYDNSIENMQNMLSGQAENEMFPIASWAQFSEKGGITGVTSFLPLADIVNALTSLYQAREQVKSDYYEITGISDIVRGQSSASETATAQRIKGTFATMRLNARRDGFAEMVRGAVEKVGQVMAENFEPETLARMANFGPDSFAAMMPEAEFQPPPQMQGEHPQMYQQRVEATKQQFEQQRLQEFTQAVMTFIKDESARSYRIEIETDSTIAVDDQMDKEAATELVVSTANLFQQFAPVIQAAPELTPFVGETIKYAFRQHRAGRQLETVLDKAIDDLMERVQAQSQQPQPNPQMLEVERKTKKDQTDAQLEARGQDMDMMKARMQTEQQQDEAQAELITHSADKALEQTQGEA